jgi:hypothetical protein
LLKTSRRGGRNGSGRRRLALLRFDLKLVEFLFSNPLVAKDKVDYVACGDVCCYEEQLAKDLEGDVGVENQPSKGGVRRENK